MSRANLTPLHQLYRELRPFRSASRQAYVSTECSRWPSHQALAQALGLVCALISLVPSATLRRNWKTWR